MLCLLSLLIFAILALFSARYRPLAKEALDCVFRRITLRKCTTGLDKRVKSMITGRLLSTHPAAARFIHRHLEAMAWVFVVLAMGATAQLAYGFYNYRRYGNCGGENADGFCIFDPTGRNARDRGTPGERGHASIAPSDAGSPALGPAGARVTIIEFGSYGCPSTRASAPVIRALARRYGNEVRFVFRHFPLDTAPGARIAEASCRETSSESAAADHDGDTRAAIAADCAAVQGRFWEYHERLLADPDTIASCDSLAALAARLGADETSFRRCLEDPAVRSHVQHDFDDGVRAGVFGTPTFFVNGTALTAPSAEVLAAQIDDALGQVAP